MNGLLPIDDGSTRMVAGRDLSHTSNVTGSGPKWWFTSVSRNDSQISVGWHFRVSTKSRCTGNGYKLKYELQTFQVNSITLTNQATNLFHILGFIKFIILVKLRCWLKRVKVFFARRQTSPSALKKKTCSDV